MRGCGRLRRRASLGRARWIDTQHPGWRADWVNFQAAQYADYMREFERGGIYNKHFKGYYELTTPQEIAALE